MKKEILVGKYDISLLMLVVDIDEENNRIAYQTKLLKATGLGKSEMNEKFSKYWNKIPLARIMDYITSNNLDVNIDAEGGFGEVMKLIKDDYINDELLDELGCVDVRKLFSHNSDSYGYLKTVMRNDVYSLYDINSPVLDTQDRFLYDLLLNRYRRYGEFIDIPKLYIDKIKEMNDVDLDSEYVKEFIGKYFQPLRR